MIWFTWRQFRTQAWVTLGALIIVGVVGVLAGRDLSNLYAASGIVGCRSDCDTVVSTFIRQASTGWLDVARNASLAGMYAIPALIGAFWGAPLFARELETGTYRLAWNQSVSRTRWLVTKLVGIGLASVATVALLSLTVTWSQTRIDEASVNRLTPLLFGTRGIVPIGYAAFAFALGVTLGLLLRRTVPALAATLAIYVVAVVAMPLWVRAHLLPTASLTQPLDAANLRGIEISDQAQRMTVFGSADVPGGWVLSNQSYLPSGQPFTGPADPAFCNVNASKDSCFNWVASLHLHQTLTYQPLSHFWPLQLIETGIFLSAALVLGGFCIWWTRRRLT